MTFPRKKSIVVTTDASGNASAKLGPIAGEIRQIIYAADGTNPYTNTVDFTITVEDTGENVWTESNISASTTRAPRLSVNGTDGAASLFAAAGTAVKDRIAVADSNLIIALVQGGNTKVGTFTVIYA